MLTDNHQNDDIIEVSHEEDTYSDAGSSVATDTTSVTSSVFNFQYENGRRYHNFRSGSYVLPNDEEEQDRLDMYHHVWNMLLKGKLHAAPLEEPKRILDLGTGTGIWAIDIADMYPDADVVGNDLSPIQPGWVPTNVSFVVDDIETEWTYPENHFDFIHARMLNCSLKDWDVLVQRIYKHLKPGGYFEFHDGVSDGWFSEDGTYKDDGNWRKYVDAVGKGASIVGRVQKTGVEMATTLVETGFTDVTHEKLKMPIGTWPKNPKQKEVGKWGLAVIEPSVEAYGLALFTRVLQMSEQQAKQVINDAVADLRNKKIHLIYQLEVVYGRKPLVA